MSCYEIKRLSVKVVALYLIFLTEPVKTAKKIFPAKIAQISIQQVP
jgi:hypothetical protein